MIDAIDILIQNGTLILIEALVVYKDKICYINNKKKPISNAYLQELKKMILSWEEEYIGPSNIDQEEFTVKVMRGSKIQVYHGKGKYPLNYHQFKELLLNIYNETR